MGEIASEIAQEYATDLKRGRDYGPLADVADAVAGPTQKLREDFAAVGQALGSGAQRLLDTSEARVAEQTARGRERIAELKAQPRRAADTTPQAQVLRDVEVPEVEAVVLESTPVEGATVVEAVLEATPVEAVFDADAGGPTAELVEVVPVSEGRALEVVQPDVAVAAVALDRLDDGLDDVLDVVAESEADPEEEQQERDAVFADALLVTAESAVRKVAGNVKNLLTPPDLRPWKPLGSFQPTSEADEKRKRAQERLLDEATRRVKRD
jgi:hypothetical protein